MTDTARPADRAPVLEALRQAINEMKSAGHLSPEPLAVAAALRELREALAEAGPWLPWAAELMRREHEHLAAESVEAVARLLQPEDGGA